MTIPVVRGRVPERRNAGGDVRPSMPIPTRRAIAGRPARALADRDTGVLKLEFRDSLTEMDSRYPFSRAQAFAGMTASLKATCLAEMTSFPRKRESIA